MLHILLLILKILGIIFLSITALAFLIVGMVLFVPITYQIRAEKRESFQMYAEGGWLFRILSVRYSADNAGEWKQDLRFCVFGFTALDFFEEKKPKKKRKEKEESKEEHPSSVRRKISDEAKEELPGKKRSYDAEGQAQPELPTIPVLGEEKKERRKSSLLERIRRLFFKPVYAIRHICGKIREIIKSLVKNVQNLTERKDTYLEFWNLEEHRRARSAIYREIRYLWKKSRPRRVEGEVRFGFEDPALTGICMGALSVLYAWYPKKFRLLPDFDQEILEGDLLIKGRFQLYAAALIFRRVWFNKDIRHMYEHWQEL